MTRKLGDTTAARLGVITFNLCAANVELVDRIAQSTGMNVSLYPLVAVSEGMVPQHARIAVKPRPARILPLNSLGTTELMCISPALGTIWRAFRNSDVVIVCGLLGAAGLTVRVMERIFRRRVAMAVQQIGYRHEVMRHWAIRTMKRWVLSPRYMYLVQTPPTREVLAKCYGIAESSMMDAPFSVTDEAWVDSLRRAEPREVFRERLGMARVSGFVVLFVGSLIDLKGVDLLIQAFLSIAGPDDELWLVGGALAGQQAYVESLKCLAEGGRSMVRFVGNLAHEKLVSFYSAADVFALPTRKDTWPKVLIEAASAGLPIVLSDTCGAAGIVVENDRNGYVVASQSIGELADALRKLRTSRELRLRMGGESRNMAAKHQDSTPEVAAFQKFLSGVAVPGDS